VTSPTVVASLIHLLLMRCHTDREREQLDRIHLQTIVYVRSLFSLFYLFVLLVCEFSRKRHCSLARMAVRFEGLRRPSCVVRDIVDIKLAPMKTARHVGRETTATLHEFLVRLQVQRFFLLPFDMNCLVASFHSVGASVVSDRFMDGKQPSR
jgi:hypothetical protein